VCLLKNVVVWIAFFYPLVGECSPRHFCFFCPWSLRNHLSCRHFLKSWKG
jgi:hypothetical protein